MQGLTDNGKYLMDQHEVCACIVRHASVQPPAVSPSATYTVIRNAFECAQHALSPIHLNIVAPNGHMGKVKRSIRTIKERLCACTHSLPYGCLPKLLLRHMVTDVVQCLSQFPWSVGISNTLSPSTIVTGQPCPDFTSMHLKFGS
jgi:hypothetical protein